MILLDTNILLYATGHEHPLREPSQTIIRAVGNGVTHGYITDVVVAEFLHTRARRAGRPAATELAQTLVGSVTDVLPLSDAARARAIDLFATTTRLSSNDVLIAAVALENGLALVTADQDFHEVAGLQLIPPDSPRAADLAAL